MSIYFEKFKNYKNASRLPSGVYQNGERPSELGDYDRKGLYTLRQAANIVGILKSERHEFFEVLRRAGVIKHNNQPTFLSLITNLFRGPNREEVPSIWARDFLELPLLLTEKGVDVINGIAKHIYFGYSEVFISDVDRFWLDREVKKITQRNVSSGW